MRLKADMKILIVDDFPVMRKLVRAALKEIGLVNTVQAKSGLDAIGRLEEGGVELVISDWNMPELDGLELLKWIRSSGRFKHLPFLMVTARGEREHVIKAVQAGVNNYIIKPFTAQDLEAKIAQVFAELAQEPPPADQE